MSRCEHVERKRKAAHWRNPVAGAEGRSHVLVVSHHGSSMGSGGVWGSATAHAEPGRLEQSSWRCVSERRGEEGDWLGFNDKGFMASSGLDVYHHAGKRCPC
jgi:hypothetical protein